MEEEKDDEKYELCNIINIEEPPVLPIYERRNKVSSNLLATADTILEMKDDTNVTKIMKEMIDAGKLISLVDFRRALQRQEAISAQINRLFEPYDFVLSVGTSSSAPLRGEEELLDPSLIWTLAHLPVVAAPAFRCPRGLPYGVQFVSSRWKDYALLQAVEELVNRGILMSGSEPTIHI